MNFYLDLKMIILYTNLYSMKGIRCLLVFREEAVKKLSLRGLQMKKHLPIPEKMADEVIGGTVICLRVGLYANLGGNAEYIRPFVFEGRIFYLVTWTHVGTQGQVPCPANYLSECSNTLC